MKRRLLFMIIIMAAPALAYSTHPWINTCYYENLKEPSSYNASEKAFIADNITLAIGHFQSAITDIKSLNPDATLLSFSGLGYFSSGYLQRFQAFLQLHPEYTQAQIEGAFIHYKCDVTLNNVLVKGCNLVNPATGTCSGTPATGCTASTATTLSEARTPDSDRDYQRLGWLQSNYLSDVYREFGVWRLKEIFSYYPQGHLPDGMMWDNILYNQNIYKVEYTIEYWGIPNSDNHPRSNDYHNYYITVRDRVMQEAGLPPSFIWLGNVNNMYWIRPGTPNLAWTLANLGYITPEAWMNPRGAGEYAMPSWVVDCSDVQEVWTYTAEDNKAMPVFMYNHADLYGKDDKTKAFSIVKYYLDKNPNLYYCYDEDSQGRDIMVTEWNPMANVNIGMPRENPAGTKDFRGQTGTNLFFNWNSQTTPPDCNLADKTNVVVARHYGNGLVIARWKGDRLQNPPPDDPRYNSDADPRAYPLANPYGTAYYIVQPDGSIPSSPVDTITLATNQAALLLNVCPDGPVTATCGCKGQVKNPGDTCTMTCPLQRYDPDCNDNIDNTGLTLAISDWIASQIPIDTLIQAAHLWKETH